MMLHETLRLIRNNAFDLLFTALVAGLLFTLGDIAALTAQDVLALTSDLKKEMTMEVYFADGVAGSDVERVSQSVRKFDGVTDVVKRSPEDALREMSTIMGSDLTEVLGFNPLPYSLEVKFDMDNHDEQYLSQVSANLAIQPEVMEVHFAADWLSSLRKLSSISAVVSSILGVLISACTLFVFAGMQRQMSSRRGAVNKGLLLLGMKPSSIYVSGLSVSLLTGLLSAILALAVTYSLWKTCQAYSLTVPFLSAELLVAALILPVGLSCVAFLASRPVSSSRDSS
jgi:cell division transport system permease protein